MLQMDSIPDNKVHGANMEPTWVLSAPDGPHVGPMKLAIRDEREIEIGVEMQNFRVDSTYPWLSATLQYLYS